MERNKELVCFIEKHMKNSNFMVENLSLHEGVVIFSASNYTKKEQNEVFKIYKDKKCLKNLYNNITKEPHSRYFYLEKLDHNEEKDCSENILTYVMLNPSYAKSDCSDSTMNRARKWAKCVVNPKDNKYYRYFAVINVYAYRHHMPSELFKIISNQNSVKTNYKIEYNLEFIKDYINTSFANDFVLAYGKNAKIDDVRNILTILDNERKSFYTYSQNLDKIPPHLLSRKAKFVYKNKSIKLHKIKLINKEDLIFQTDITSTEMDA